VIIVVYLSVMTGTRTDFRWGAARVPANFDALGTAGGGISFGTRSGGNQTRGVTTEGNGATYAGVVSACTIGAT
jgi:hypothetical protein